MAHSVRQSYTRPVEFDRNLLRINTTLARTRSDLRTYITAIAGARPDLAAELERVDADLTEVIEAIGLQLRAPDGRPQKTPPLEYDDRD